MRKLHMPYIQISYAARCLYATGGPKALTMRALGRAVGVRASALYRHFKNKDAIVETIVDASERELARQLIVNPRLRPPKDRLGYMAERALCFSKEQPHLFQLLTRRRVSWRPEEDGPRATHMRSEIRKAMDKRQLRKDDVPAVVASVWALICGLVAVKERGEPEDWLGTTQRMFQGLRAA
jgi:AcrR family transcriptional regulator